MNKVILSGRLTRDPEVRYSQGEKPIAIARYSLAVDRKYKSEGQPDVDFIRCCSMGKAGEFVEKYLTQGTKVIVEGRMQTGSYQNKDGNNVSYTEVITENIEFAESKKASGEKQSNTQPANGAPAGQTDNSDGFMNIPDDLGQLPFNFDNDEGMPFK